MKNLILNILAPVLLLSAAQAQYSIESFVVSGGGGASQGGNYALTGTIGQSDVGRMSGGTYELDGGFWASLSLPTAIIAPTLILTRTGTNTFLISWPSPSTGFALQQNRSLATSNWAAAPLAVTDDGIRRTVVVSPTAGDLYFRLKK